MLHKVRRLIKHEISYEDFFFKYDAESVYETQLDLDWIEKDYPKKMERYMQ